jgi:hypothetical protein
MVKRFQQLKFTVRTLTPLLPRKLEAEAGDGFLMRKSERE